MPLLAELLNEQSSPALRRDAEELVAERRRVKAFKAAQRKADQIARKLKRAEATARAKPSDADNPDDWEKPTPFEVVKARREASELRAELVETQKVMNDNMR